MKEEFIKHDFRLPDHSAELSKAEDVIEKLKNRFKKIIETQSINGKIHTDLYEEIVRVLDYLGRLSNPAFAIGAELEALYVLQYPKSPQLAKKLWLDFLETELSGGLSNSLAALIEAGRIKSEPLPL